MRINFKKLHPNAVLPRVAHSRDYGFDCVAVTEGEVAPGVWRYGLSVYSEVDELDNGERGSNGYGSTGL